MSCAKSLLLLVSLIVSRAAESWTGRAVYQVLIDRFARGNNDESPCPEIFQEHFCGGTIKGITEKLDYIESLGVGTVMLTPVFANSQNSFMGYNVIDFYRVEPHFGGKWTDLLELAHGCHNKGMKLIVDIVMNNVSPVEDIRSIVPFNKTEHYNHKEKHCYGQPYRYNATLMTNCWVGNTLPDLNQNNEDVKKLLFQIAGNLRNSSKVDGFRLSAAWAIPIEFLQEFTQKLDSFMITDVPFTDIPFVSSYQEHGNSVLNYPLYSALKAIYWDGGDFSSIHEYMKSMQSFKDMNLLGNFIDAPGYDRFIKHTDLNGFKNALAWILMFPGIPIIYYGDEQGLAGQPQSPLWPNYNQTSELYHFIKSILNYKTSHNTNKEKWEPIDLPSEISKTTYAAQRGNSFLIFTSSASKSIVKLDIESGKLCDIVVGTCASAVNGIVEITMEGAPRVFDKQPADSPSSDCATLLTLVLFSLLLT